MIYSKGEALDKAAEITENSDSVLSHEIAAGYLEAQAEVYEHLAEKSRQCVDYGSEERAARWQAEEFILRADAAELRGE